MFSPKKRRKLPEDAYPRTKEGGADLRYYTEPPEYYDLYIQRYLDLKREQSADDAHLAWSYLVHAESGFISNGSKSIPYVISRLRNKDSHLRQILLGVLGDLCRNEQELASAFVDAARSENRKEGMVAIVDVAKSLNGKRRRVVEAALRAQGHWVDVDD